MNNNIQNHIAEKRHSALIRREQEKAKEEFLAADFERMAKMCMYLAQLNNHIHAAYQEWRSHAAYFTNDINNKYYAPKFLQGIMHVAMALDSYHEAMLIDYRRMTDCAERAKKMKARRRVRTA